MTMKEIMLICYGNSEENLQATLKTNIIGIKNNVNLPDNQLIYLIIKRNNCWFVVGRANVLSKSNDNPFDTKCNYYTYNVSPIEQCTPYSITDICRKELGTRYGLVLITPRLISAANFVNYINNHFEPIK